MPEDPSPVTPGPPVAGVMTAPAAAGLVTVVGCAVLLLGLALSPAGSPVPAADAPAAWPMAAAAAVLVAALAWGWPTLLALPGPRGVTGMVAGAGLVCVLVVATTPGGASLERLPAVLGLTVLAACAHQLLRRDGRPRVVDALGGTLLGCALAAAAACWTTLPAMVGGREVAAVTIFAALVIAVLLAPVPRWWRAVTVAALLGVAVVLDALRAGQPATGLGSGLGLGGTAVVGVLVLVLASGVGAVLDRQSSARTRVRGRVAVVGAFLALLGPVAHLVAAALG